ncbi:STAS domain-containing protein [Shewanella eurypsychrophilus]|uniref:STAS domain-containing protein n=1 Tax=Shewanella eurypsychrophilus TaxID=2593656 RepID=A0ABX6VBE5_9GAMM|nr:MULTISPECIES: STAS domain-containing protein [Shewanella]QFU24485.1 STAS domain-containing protein [Shewanella sp. YLB-09]QPG59684.1 STAS domain-containing protein [Shewanella eurypsychrophilus]
MADFLCDGAICRITGSLSQQEVVKLWDERKRLVDKGAKVLDLSGLTYSDSAGIAFLLELISLAKKQGRVLTLSSASIQLSKLIALYDLELFFIEEAKQGK